MIKSTVGKEDLYGHGYRRARQEPREEPCTSVKTWPPSMMSILFDSSEFSLHFPDMRVP